MVRSDIKGHGLGHLLMTEILSYARARGVGTVYGEVLRENTTMLKMADDLGFTRGRSEDEPGVVHVSIRLREEGAGRGLPRRTRLGRSHPHPSTGSG